MDILGQFVLFCLGLYTTIIATRITSLTFRYWAARRIIDLEFRKAITINQHISPRDKVAYDERTVEIAEQIIIQMCQGLKYQRKWMIRHAIQHFAVLYHTTVWLKNDPDDMRLYDALDVIKQKFYYMHGTFINIKKSQLRNNIHMEMYTTSGDLLTSVEDVAKYNKQEQGAGCKIKITFSLVTPLTSKNYVYLNHL